MKGKFLLLAAVLTLTAPVAQADNDGKTFKISFSESTLVFQCREEETLRNLLKGVDPENMKAELTERVTVVRGEILPNGNPKCDFLVTPEGKYGLYTQLTEVALIDSYTRDIGNGVSLEHGFYVIHDIAGDPMYMFLVFPIENNVAKPGFDLISRVLGSN